MNIAEKKVLFVDLDGTLIETRSGASSPKWLLDMKIKIDILDIIRKFRPEAVVIVTNQGGIERGELCERDFVKGKMAYLVRCIREYTGVPCEFQYCASDNPENPYRKPNCGMFESVCKKTLKQIGVEAEKSEMLLVSASPELDSVSAKNFGIDFLELSEFCSLVSAL